MFLKNVIRDFGSIYPSIMLNKSNGSMVITIPGYKKHWNISSNHESRIYDIIADSYDKITLSDNLINESYYKSVIKDNKFILDLANNIYHDNNITSSTNIELSIYLLEHFLLSILMTYINTFKNGDNNINEKNVSDIIIIMLNLMWNAKHNTQINYELIQERAIKIIAKEKDIFTDRLLHMGKELRRIDTENRKIGQGIYAIGTQKDLRVYNKDTYDEHMERVKGLAEYETDIIGLGETDIYDGDDNVNNYDNNDNTVDVEQDQMNINEAAMIEMEEYEIIGNDDDYNDGNGDYDDYE
jgi:hypothetical protein